MDKRVLTELYSLENSILPQSITLDVSKIKQFLKFSFNQETFLTF